MNFVFRKAALMGALAAAMIIAPVAGQVKAADKVTITWFVGLGNGTDKEQIDIQNKVVEKFNASHPDIELKINIAATNTAAYDSLATLIASGNAPDIVGPVGFSGANSFPGSWLDVRPIVEKTGYDLKQFPDGLVKLYDTPEGLVGLPFAVFPSFIYYNQDLFDEAGIAYPPQEFGKPYKQADGTEVEWNWDTLASIAKKLTVDANGNDATSDKFDPTKIVQFGFEQQFQQQRNEFSSFGGGYFWDAATNKVAIPENWREQAQWTYDALWKSHFIPNSTYENSDLLKPNVFASGKVAMARTHLWYTCCISDLKSKFNFAVMPAYKGVQYSTVDADTYRIIKTTKNPEQAFTVLTYLIGDASLDLLNTYGGFPARASDQASFLKARQEKYPDVNFDVAVQSLNYAAAPNHESDFPGFKQGMQRFNDFRTLMYGDTGKDVDVKVELDKLEADLQKIVDEANKK